MENMTCSILKKKILFFCKRFGPGPHRVKFEIEFHPDEIPEGNGTSFIIEMAPLDLVSH